MNRHPPISTLFPNPTLFRSPPPVHRLYTATFGPGGVVERFELITHNVSGGPGPLERRATASFSGDTAVMTVPRGGAGGGPARQDRPPGAPLPGPGTRPRRRGGAPRPGSTRT